MILIFLGIATIPFLLATAQALVKFQNSQRESIILQERRIASDAAKEIASFIRLQFAAVEAVGEFQQRLSGDKESLNELVERELFSHSDLFELSVVSVEGKESARVHRTKVISPADLLDHSNSEKFLAVRKNRRYIGPIFWENNGPFFVIGEGFFSSRDEFLGAVFAQLDARVMQSVVSNLSVAKELGRASIFDKDGIVIAHQDFSKVALKENFSHIGIVAEALKSKDRIAVAGIFQNEQGEEVIGASDHIAVLFGGLGASAISLDTSWFVVAEIPSYIALASVRDSTIFSVVVLLVVLLVAAVAALILAGKIVKPIEQLKLVVQKFRDGQLEYKTPIKTGDEIEDLATSFYTMADELRESMKTITESKRVVESGKRQLEHIISGITDAVIVTDTKGRVIVFNKIAEIMTGYAVGDVIKKHIDEVVGIWDQGRRLDVMKEYVDRSELPRGVMLARDGLLLLGKDKKEAYANVTIGEIESGERVDVGRIVTLHDISRDQLIKQMKIDFVSIAAHQLRTPLSVLKWVFSLFSEEAGGKMSLAQKELIKKGELSTRRMINLVNDLLNVSRIEEGKFDFVFGQVFIEELIKKWIKEEGGKTKEKDIKLTFEKPEEKLPAIKADEEKLSLAFQNLIENALNYTNKGGRVRISLKYDMTNLIVEIEDSGIGIPKKQLDMLFTKFFRGENAIKLQTDGSGLGLFIAKNIIESHGGKIKVESEEGKGTKVTVSLPKMEGTLPERKPQKFFTNARHDNHPKVNTNHRKILIVEDSEVLLGLLKDGLTKEGYNVISAEDGKTALKMIENSHPDLVLLDIALPEMDGISVLKEVRGNPATSFTAVIIISNSGQPVEIEKVKQLGIEDYLIKTDFEPREVFEKVDDYFEKLDKRK